MDRKQHKVIHQSHLPLNEGLGISDPRKQTIMARSRKGAFPDIVLGDEEPAASGLIRILRAVSEKGLQPLLDIRSDIDDEGGTDIGVKGGVKNLVGPMWRSRASRNFKLAETAAKAGLIAEGSGRVMVRMAPLPIRQDNHSWPQTAEGLDDLEPVRLRVFDVAVGKIKRLAMGDPEDTGGLLGLGAALLGGAPGPGLPLGKVEDACLPSSRLHGKQRPAAGLFDVVTMRGDSENIEHRRQSGCEGKLLRTRRAAKN